MLQNRAAQDRPSPAEEKEPRRRAVHSDRDYKAYVPNNGPIPIVSLSAIASGRCSPPKHFRPPEVQPPLLAPTGEIIQQEEADWTQHWDEEVGSHYYFNQVTGEARWFVPNE